MKRMTKRGRHIDKYYDSLDGMLDIYEQGAAAGRFTGEDRSGLIKWQTGQRRLLGSLIGLDKLLDHAGDATTALTRCDTETLDGDITRMLTDSEIKQIAGRAGRYGMNEYGEVLVMGNNSVVRDKLGKSVRNVRAACIAFPREVLGLDDPIALLLKAWQSMEPSSGFVREDMRDPQILLKCLSGLRALETEKELVFDLITCPVDTRTEELVSYWAECARAILKKKRVPAPYFGTETLQDCELQYKAYDIRHQLLRRIGEYDDCTAERSAICERIAELMKENKDQYIRRCRVCGRELPIGSRFNICEECYVRGEMI